MLLSSSRVVVVCGAGVFTLSKASLPNNDLISSSHLCASSLSSLCSDLEKVTVDVRHTNSTHHISFLIHSRRFVGLLQREATQSLSRILEKRQKVILWVHDKRGIQRCVWKLLV